MKKENFRNGTELQLFCGVEDGGWRINHWVVSNQPYYPSKENYRKMATNTVLCAAPREIPPMSY